ncbi:MAG: amidohydrolase, partial [Betaproteobacteria bacterium]
QQKGPGFFYFVGITPRRIDQSGVDVKHSAPNHSPSFFVDESALLLGVRSLAHLTLDYMASPPRAS